MTLTTNDRNWLRIAAVAVFALAALIAGDILLMVIGNVVADGVGVVPALLEFIATLGVVSIVLIAAAGVYFHQARAESSQRGGTERGQ